MSTTDELALEKLSKMLETQGLDSICDYGCGDGKLLFQLANMYPEKRFTGIDTFSQWPREKVPQNTENVSFIDRHGPQFAELIKHPTFDVLSTICTIHHFGLPISELRILESLLHRPKGKLLIIDFAFSNENEGERVKNLLSFTSEMASLFIGGYHRHHYQLDELKDLLSATNLKINEAYEEKGRATEEELANAKVRARNHLERIRGRVSKMTESNALPQYFNCLLEQNSSLIEELPIDYSSIIVLLASVV